MLTVKKLTGVLSNIVSLIVTGLVFRIIPFNTALVDLFRKILILFKSLTVTTF
jgi:hypothetical protein